ncbi:hypothetical protein QQ008_07520 [Fulvivirgaceae bacterium BMA10]|uniref:PIG-L family deacetylase n=1 Tax=Splendidivirga corallicola TaxID=3051826 RepID=A0ABT8KKH1_9BACT|nr:hypothetical protein [Fulvivirgaceae bacterium BMA10]
MEEFNRYIILSPHSDDVAFSLGAFIISNNLKDIHVLTFFSRSTCTAKNEKMDVDIVTRIRKKEDEQFFKFCKSKAELFYFDFLDAPIRLNIKEEDVCSTYSTALEKSILNKVEHTLLNLITNDSIILSPLGLGGHVDHLLVREIALKLLRTGYNVGFYEDLPYAGNFLQNAIYHKVFQLNGKYNITLKPLIIDSSLTINDKVKACSNYSSQIENSTIDRIKKYHSQFDNQLVSERIWLQ